MEMDENAIIRHPAFIRPTDIDQKVADGKGVICNVNFGFCIKVTEADDGRANIEIDPEPINAGNPVCAALRGFMEDTAVEWLRQVAPHRLALGANER
jgi:hypothetical protein